MKTETWCRPEGSEAAADQNEKKSTVMRDERPQGHRTKYEEGSNLTGKTTDCI